MRSPSQRTRGDPGSESGMRLLRRQNLLTRLPSRRGPSQEDPRRTKLRSSSKRSLSPRGLQSRKLRRNQPRSRQVARRLPTTARKSKAKPARRRGVLE